MDGEIHEAMTGGPTPGIDEAYPVTTENVNWFAEHGFIKLPGVFGPATIERYEPEITSKVIELNTLHLPMAQRSTYQKAFLQVENLWQRSEAVRQFVFGRRLARMAADLLGVSGVRLYHDQALYKEAGGGITPWHADQYYWPLSTDRACTAWVPLQATPSEMGPLSFADASHLFSYGRDLPISDQSEDELQKALADHGLTAWEEPYELGDVSFHMGWTFHRASPNTTSTPRRVMTIIYIGSEVRVTEPVNKAQENDRQKYLGGLEPGRVAAGPLNPLLYERA